MKTEIIAFDEFVAYGKENGGNIVNGMPWSFEFKGFPVSHENDQCYLITTPENTIKFTPKNMLEVTGSELRLVTNNKREQETTSPIMQYFAYEHLPEKLQIISKPIGDVAKRMDDILPPGPEKSAGLRKLLEAKDCLVRANLNIVRPQEVP